MKQVLLRGPFLTSSGYGVHSRQVARWALSKKEWNVVFQVLPWGHTPWILSSHAENGLIGEIMKRSVPLEVGERYDLSIQIQLPNEWDPNLGKENVGITAAVETDRCNPEWIKCCNRMSLVVVPSSHTKETLVRTATQSSGASLLTTDIQIVKESFYDEILDAKPRHKNLTSFLDLDLPSDFNFLIFGQITGKTPESDRKNLFYTIKWIFEEFKDDENVGIVLKTNSGKNSKIDRKVTTQTLMQVINLTRKGAYPRVHLVHGSMTKNEMIGLMQHPKICALVSLTRGEGYGLPLLEAAAMGMPIVATGWSGHTDFLRDDMYTSVDYSLQPIHESRVDQSIFLKGTRWAEPNEADAKKKMRSIFRKPRTFAMNARRAVKRIREDFSHEAISKEYDKVLEDFL